MKLINLTFVLMAICLALSNVSVTYADESEVSATEESAAASDDVIIEEDEEIDEDEELDDEEDVEIEMPVDEPLSNDAIGVSSRYTFPDAEDSKFTIGEDGAVLIGLNNNGGALLNVSYVWGHLVSKYDASYYVQNFTAQYVGQILQPGSHLSIEYNFKPDPMLEPVDFKLLTYVLYNGTGADAQRVYRNTATDAEITLLPQVVPVDIKLVLNKLIALGSILLVLYVIFMAFGKHILGAKTAKKIQQQIDAATQLRKPAPKPTTGETWDDVVAYKQGTAKRRGAKKSRGKK